jgi:hypothetical protein
MKSWIAAAVGLVLAAGAVAVILNAERILDRFAPFDFDRQPGLLSTLHLQLFRSNPGRCFAALDRGAVTYAPAPAQEMKNGCGYSDAARLKRSEVSYGSHLLLRCPAMAALLLWERQVLTPAAARYGKKLTGVRHLGTYACRNRNNRHEGMRSEHATANAIDIAGFSFEDGSAITVAKDWADDGAKGRFLRDVRDSACRVFNGVLSPDYNGLHRTHFHLDMGPWPICR